MGIVIFVNGKNTPKFKKKPTLKSGELKKDVFKISCNKESDFILNKINIDNLVYEKVTGRVDNRTLIISLWVKDIIILELYLPDFNFSGDTETGGDSHWNYKDNLIRHANELISRAQSGMKIDNKWVKANIDNYEKGRKAHFKDWKKRTREEGNSIARELTKLVKGEREWDIEVML